MGAPGGGSGHVFFVERPRVDPDDSEVHVIYDEEDQQPFAADVRIACLQSQDTPLLSIHDLDRSLKQQGGYAKVAWGDYSALTVSDGYAVVEIPLERVGAYIRLRGTTAARPSSSTQKGTNVSSSTLAPGSAAAVLTASS